MEVDYRERQIRRDRADSSDTSDHRTMPARRERPASVARHPLPDVVDGRFGGVGDRGARAVRTALCEEIRMSIVLIFVVFGIAIIAGFGFLGRNTTATSDLGEWAVGGRRLGTAATWLLQAGESFTTFTFVGLVALSFA